MRNCYLKIASVMALILVGCLAGIAPEASAGLVAHWKLDEGSGSTAADSAGGHTGTLTNFEGDEWITTALPPVPDGTTAALQFDGTGAGNLEHIVAGGYKGVTGTQERTVSAWIKTPSSGTPDRAILAWGTDSAEKKWIFRVQASNGTAGAIRVEVNGGFVVGQTPVNDNQWHHVVAVLPAGKTNVQDITLYVDGVYDGYSARQSKAINTAVGQDVEIGQDQSNRYFNGQMDDVRIYDHDLLPADVMSLYTGTALTVNDYRDAVLFDAPLAYWRLNETSGTRAWNIGSGGASHPDTKNATYAGGTLLGQPGLLATESDPAAGFDGSDDRVNVPDHAEINTGASYDRKTIEAWFSADDVAGRQVVYEQGGTGNGLNVYVEGGNVHVGAWKGTEYTLFVDEPVQAGVPYHVALVFDQPNEAITGYLNGTAFGTATKSGMTTMPVHSGDVAIGAMRNDSRYDNGTANGQNETGDGRHLAGAVDEVALYDTALSPGRLGNHYAMGRVPSRLLLDADPIAYWRLGERSGTTAVNIATSNSGLGSAVDGTYTGATTLGRPGLIHGEPDTATALDGATGRVEIPRHDAIGGATSSSVVSYPEKTFQLWFDADNAVSRQMLYEEGGGGNGLNIYLEDGRVHVGAWKNNGNDFAHFLDAPVRPGVTNHVALVFDQPNNAFTGYVNGSAFDTASGLIAMGNHYGGVAIGAMNNDGRIDDGTANGAGLSGHGLRFAGTIDEVVLYNSALSARQIGLQQASSEPYAQMVLESAPIAYWRLGESGNVATAVNLGSLTNNATYQGTSPNGVQSLVHATQNWANRFNGTNDAARIADAAGFNTGGPFAQRTVELWFNADDVATGKQVLFDEGGITRGLNLYTVEENGADLLYFGVWSVGNNADSNWEQFLSTPIEEGRDYHVALVLDSNAQNDESGQVLAYVNGMLRESWTGANRLFEHGDDSAIGAMIQNSRFHDGNGSGDGLFFQGVIDEVAVYNLALPADVIAQHYAVGLVPEPSTVVLLIVGLIGLGACRLRRRRRPD